MLNSRVFLALALLVVGCDSTGSTSDAGHDAGAPLFVDVQYAVRCIASGDCAGPVNGDVCGFAGGLACDGVSGVAEATCEVVDGVFSFTASQGGPVLSIDNFGPAGTSLSDCTVTVEVDGETFRGPCSGEASPCALGNVRTYDDEGNPTIEGQVYCDGLPSPDGLSTREITALGVGPAVETSPGRFRVANCAGL